MRAAHAGGEGDPAAAEVQTEPRQDTDATTEAETHVLFWSVEFPASLNSCFPPFPSASVRGVQHLPMRGLWGCAPGVFTLALGVTMMMERT